MGPLPSSLVMANDQVIPAQCKGVVMARLESTLEVGNGFTEPSLETPATKELNIARTLAPVRVLNATYRDHKLTKGSSLAYCEPVTLVTPPDVEQP
jgi:hypothetical protein